MKASLLAFVKMTRVLRRAGVIDGRRLTIRLRSEKDECRLYIQRSPAQVVPGLYLLGKRSYLQPIITQYFIDNKSEIWLLFLIAHSKR